MPIKQNWWSPWHWIFLTCIFLHHPNPKLKRHFENLKYFLSVVQDLTFLSCALTSIFDWQDILNISKYPQYINSKAKNFQKLSLAQKTTFPDMHLSVQKMQRFLRSETRGPHHFPIRWLLRSISLWSHSGSAVSMQLSCCLVYLGNVSVGHLWSYHKQVSGNVCFLHQNYMKNNTIEKKSWISAGCRDCKDHLITDLFHVT